MATSLLRTLRQNGAQMHNYIQPEKPTQNAFIEHFKGSYKRGVLNKYIFEDIHQDIFEDIHQVREQTQIWMHDYYYHRPHDALGKMSPVKYAKLYSSGASPRRIKNNNFIEVLEK